MIIKNKKEVDEFLWQNAAIKEHFCQGIRDESNSHNVAWLDTVTGERIEIIYSTEEE